MRADFPAPVLPHRIRQQYPPVFCAYWPVRVVARDGAQMGTSTKALRSVIPAPPTRLLMLGVATTSPVRMSSARTKTMFGRVAARAGPGPATPGRSASAAASQAHRRPADDRGTAAADPAGAPRANAGAATVSVARMVATRI